MKVWNFNAHVNTQTKCIVDRRTHQTYLYNMVLTDSTANFVTLGWNQDKGLVSLTFVTKDKIINRSFPFNGIKQIMVHSYKGTARYRQVILQVDDISRMTYVVRIALDIKDDEWCWEPILRTDTTNIRKLDFERKVCNVTFRDGTHRNIVFNGI